MKKLFTLVALLAMVLGAQAGDMKKIYSVDYSTYTAFPFYVMGYVPEWNSGIMTDLGGSYTYANKAEEDAKEDGKSSDVVVTTSAGVEYYRLESTGTWHQYFIADNIPTEVGGAYHVKALVKASKAVTINVNMGWSWQEDPKSANVSIPAGDDFVEVEWDYTEIGGSSCNLVAQPNTDAQIEWKSLEVYTEESTVPVTWLQMLTNDGKALDEEGHSNKYMGDAEFGAWPEWSLKEEGGINANWRGDRTGEICAWALTMGKNFDSENTVVKEDSPRSRPYPADIEKETGNETNHVFAVHVDKVAAIDDDASIAWSNQFWIQSPKEWKAGTKVKIHFRYKADRAQRTETQFHKIHPSDYLWWNAVGEVKFTTAWQEFDKTVELTSDMAGATSLAFNLNPDAANGDDGNPKDPNSLEPNVFYFDDLSWEVLKLDEGYFVAGKGESVAYDYTQAIQFTQDPEDPDVYVATIGTEGKKDSWVNEIQISTVRGDKSAFLGATLKPTGTIKLNKFGLSAWLDYSESSQAKIKLPAAGVWAIEIDTDAKQMRFEEVEGDTPAEAVDVVTNTTEILVKGVERQDLKDDKAADTGVITVKEEADDPAGVNVGGEGHEGMPWDNQFFIIANREIKSGENVTLKFKYKANKGTEEAPVKTTTQLHGAPGAYVFWNALGDVNFVDGDWKEFSKTWVIPQDNSKDITFKSIAFNMAEIKEACDYYIKDVQWYLSNDTEGKTEENLINATGTENFFVKIGAGTAPYQYGTNPSGIETVTAKTAKTSTAIYNLAGQRVANDYKGIVVKNGKKFVVK